LASPLSPRNPPFSDAQSLYLQRISTICLGTGGSQPEPIAEAAFPSLTDKERKCWFETQKESLLASRVKTVLATLGDLAEAKDGEDENEPITTTISYFKKRENQFDYADAIRRELPIGSGEVESAHRHILQKRLKIPGAWWRLERAEEMAQLRAMRANGRWNDFWQKKAA